MKIRSLLLGTVAAAGLTTGAFATDLGVETSLDVCDDLGLTGLTISSDTNCLQISGSVKYTFTWGDYNDAFNNTMPLMSNFSATGDSYLVDHPNETGVPGNADGNDWESSFDSYLKFVATADSSFGPASAVIKFDLDEMYNNNTANAISQLYVTIGEGTVFTAGLADSIFKDGEDTPRNFLGLFESESVDEGVTAGGVATGGEVLQVVTSMDNFWIGGALEDLSGSGSAVGVVAYSTDDIKAHASFAAGGILDGTVNSWQMHAGFEGTFDNFGVTGAFATASSGYWDALGSISATFDTFTVALSGEATSATEWGVGGSIMAEVSDGVTVKLGARHYTNGDVGPTDTLDQIAGQVVAAVSDEVTLTGEAGYITNGAGSLVNPGTSLFYGSGKAEWSPGGDFKASVKGEANSLGAYKITTSAEKSF